ncbi:hypothetical protein ADUPG1_011474, partial [Aduncisulcus paluster]
MLSSKSQSSITGTSTDFGKSDSTSISFSSSLFSIESNSSLSNSTSGIPIRHPPNGIKSIGVKKKNSKIDDKTQKKKSRISDRKNKKYKRQGFDIEKFANLGSSTSQPSFSHVAQKEKKNSSLSRVQQMEYSSVTKSTYKSSNVNISNKSPNSKSPYSDQDTDSSGADGSSSTALSSSFSSPSANGTLSSTATSNSAGPHSVHSSSHSLHDGSQSAGHINPFQMSYLDSASDNSIQDRLSSRSESTKSSVSDKALVHDDRDSNHFFSSIRPLLNSYSLQSAVIGKPRSSVFDSPIGYGLDEISDRSRLSEIGEDEEKDTDEDPDGGYNYHRSELSDEIRMTPELVLTTHSSGLVDGFLENQSHDSSPGSDKILGMASTTIQSDSLNPIHHFSVKEEEEEEEEEKESKSTLMSMKADIRHALGKIDEAKKIREMKRRKREKKKKKDKRKKKLLEISSKTNERPISTSGDDLSDKSQYSDLRRNSISKNRKGIEQSVSFVTTNNTLSSSAVPFHKTLPKSASAAITPMMSRSGSLETFNPLSNVSLLSPYFSSIVSNFKALTYRLSNILGDTVVSGVYCGLFQIIVISIVCVRVVGETWDLSFILTINSILLGILCMVFYVYPSYVGIPQQIVASCTLGILCGNTLGLILGIYCFPFLSFDHSNFWLFTFFSHSLAQYRAIPAIMGICVIVLCIFFSFLTYIIFRVLPWKSTKMRLELLCTNDDSIRDKNFTEVASVRFSKEIVGLKGIDINTKLNKNMIANPNNNNNSNRLKAGLPITNSNTLSPSKRKKRKKVANVASGEHSSIFRKLRRSSDGVDPKSIVVHGSPGTLKPSPTTLPSISHLEKAEEEEEEVEEVDRVEEAGNHLEEIDEDIVSTQPTDSGYSYISKSYPGLEFNSPIHTLMDVREEDDHNTLPDIPSASSESPVDLYPLGSLNFSGALSERSESHNLSNQDQEGDATVIPGEERIQRPEEEFNGYLMDLDHMSSEGELSSIHPESESEHTIDLGTSAIFRNHKSIMEMINPVPLEEDGLSSMESPRVILAETTLESESNAMVQPESIIDSSLKEESLTGDGSSSPSVPGVIDSFAPFSAPPSASYDSVPLSSHDSHSFESSLDLAGKPHLLETISHDEQSYNPTTSCSIEGSEYAAFRGSQDMERSYSSEEDKNFGKMRELINLNTMIHTISSVGDEAYGRSTHSYGKGRHNALSSSENISEEQEGQGTQHGSHGSHGYSFQQSTSSSTNPSNRSIPKLNFSTIARPLSILKPLEKKMDYDKTSIQKDKDIQSLSHLDESTSLTPIEFPHSIFSQDVLPKPGVKCDGSDGKFSPTLPDSTPRNEETSTSYNSHERIVNQQEPVESNAAVQIPPPLLYETNNLSSHQSTGSQGQGIQHSSTAVYSYSPHGTKHWSSYPYSDQDNENNSPHIVEEHIYPSSSPLAGFSMNLGKNNFEDIFCCKYRYYVEKNLRKNKSILDHYAANDEWMNVDKNKKKAEKLKRRMDKLRNCKKPVFPHADFFHLSIVPILLRLRDLSLKNSILMNISIHEQHEYDSLELIINSFFNLMPIMFSENPNILCLQALFSMDFSPQRLLFVLKKVENTVLNSFSNDQIPMAEFHHTSTGQLSSGRSSANLSSRTASLSDLSSSHRTGIPSQERYSDIYTVLMPQAMHEYRYFVSKCVNEITLQGSTRGSTKKKRTIAWRRINSYLKQLSHSFVQFWKILKDYSTRIHNTQEHINTEIRYIDNLQTQLNYQTKFKDDLLQSRIEVLSARSPENSKSDHFIFPSLQRHQGLQGDEEADSLVHEEEKDSIRGEDREFSDIYEDHIHSGLSEGSEHLSNSNSIEHQMMEARGHITRMEEELYDIRKGAMPKLSQKLKDIQKGIRVLDQMYEILLPSANVSVLRSYEFFCRFLVKDLTTARRAKEASDEILGISNEYGPAGSTATCDMTARGGCDDDANRFAPPVGLGVNNSILNNNNYIRSISTSVEATKSSGSTSTRREVDVQFAKSVSVVGRDSHPNPTGTTSKLLQSWKKSEEMLTNTQISSALSSSSLSKLSTLNTTGQQTSSRGKDNSVMFRLKDNDDESSVKSFQLQRRAFHREVSYAGSVGSAIGFGIGNDAMDNQKMIFFKSRPTSKKMWRIMFSFEDQLEEFVGIDIETLGLKLTHGVVGSMRSFVKSKMGVLMPSIGCPFFGILIVFLMVVSFLSISLVNLSVAHVNVESLIHMNTSIISTHELIVQMLNFPFVTSMSRLTSAAQSIINGVHCLLFECEITSSSDRLGYMPDLTSSSSSVSSISEVQGILGSYASLYTALITDNDDYLLSFPSYNNLNDLTSITPIVTDLFSDSVLRYQYSSFPTLADLPDVTEDVFEEDLDSMFQPMHSQVNYSSSSGDYKVVLIRGVEFLVDKYGNLIDFDFSDLSYDENFFMLSSIRYIHEIARGLEIFSNDYVLSPNLLSIQTRSITATQNGNIFSLIPDAYEIVSARSFFINPSFKGILKTTTNSLIPNLYSMLDHREEAVYEHFNSMKRQYLLIALVVIVGCACINFVFFVFPISKVQMNLDLMMGSLLHISPRNFCKLAKRMSKNAKKIKKKGFLERTPSTSAPTLAVSNSAKKNLGKAERKYNGASRGHSTSQTLNSAINQLSKIRTTQENHEQHKVPKIDIEKLTGFRGRIAGDLLTYHEKDGLSDTFRSDRRRFGPVLTAYSNPERFMTPSFTHMSLGPQALVDMSHISARDNGSRNSRIKGILRNGRVSETSSPRTLRGIQDPSPRDLNDQSDRESESEFVGGEISHVKEIRLDSQHTASAEIERYRVSSSSPQFTSIHGDVSKKRIHNFTKPFPSTFVVNPVKQEIDRIIMKGYNKFGTFSPTTHPLQTTQRGPGLSPSPITLPVPTASLLRSS